MRETRVRPRAPGRQRHGCALCALPLRVRTLDGAARPRRSGRWHRGRAEGAPLLSGYFSLYDRTCVGLRPIRSCVCELCTLYSYHVRSTDRTKVQSTIIAKPAQNRGPRSHMLPCRHADLRMAIPGHRIMCSCPKNHTMNVEGAPFDFCLRHE